MVQVLVQAYSGLEHRALWLHGYKQEIYKEAKQMLTEMVGNDIAHEIINAVDFLHETIKNMREIALS